MNDSIVLLQKCYLINTNEQNTTVLFSLIYTKFDAFR